MKNLLRKELRPRTLTKAQTCVGRFWGRDLTFQFRINMMTKRGIDDGSSHNKCINKCKPLNVKSSTKFSTENFKKSKGYPTHPYVFSIFWPKFFLLSLWFDDRIWLRDTKKSSMPMPIAHFVAFKRTGRELTSQPGGWRGGPKFHIPLLDAITRLNE